MPCPRCGYDGIQADTCPRCGVVVAKYRPERSRPILSAARTAHEPARAAPSSGARRAAVRPAPAPRDPRPPSRAGIVVLLAGLLTAAAVAALILRPRVRPPRTAGDATPRATAPAPPQATVAPVAPTVDLAPVIVPQEVPGGAAPEGAEGLTEEEFGVVADVAARVPDHVSERDAARVEELLQRFPEKAQLRDLLAGVLMALGRRDLEARRFAQAQARFERAATLSPNDPRPHVGLHNVFSAVEDWPRAEAAIHAALERDPRNLQAQRALAYALFRQDRNREALEVLRTLLASAEDAGARALMQRLQAAMVDEQGMTEQRLARFHVRYDGDAHEDVGREILRALERHYATLASTLDHQLTTVVPVILFSRQSYYAASGAPAWSGGVFDQIDGRIRIPIGGLTASLTPDMDGTLIHELTHAFVHDRSRGQAPRELHEGLAQYLEGKRLDGLLDADGAAALAGGRIGGVMGFYLEALAFTEYLMGQRGQSGINDLLRVMGESGDVDRAFRDVYGSDHAGVRRAWRGRFRQQAGA